MSMRKNRRPIAPRQKMDGQSGSDEVGSVAPAELGDELEALRERARSLGYSLSRGKGPSSPRPGVRKGRVRVMGQVSPEVRNAMEAARWELDVPVTQIIEEGVILWLSRNGIRLEGVPSPGDLH